MQYEVRINYQIINESPVEFPAISICNLNPFDLKFNQQTADYIRNILIKNNLSSIVSLEQDQLAYNTVKEISNILKASVVSNKSSTDEQIRSLGFDLDLMLISCSYNGIKCTASNFSMFHSYQYGNCFTFNGLYDSSGNQIEVKRTSKSDRKSSLVIELFTGVSGYLTKLHTELKF